MTNAVFYTVTGDYSHFQNMAVSIYSLIKNYNSKEKLTIIVLSDYVPINYWGCLVRFPDLMGKEQIVIELWEPPKEKEFFKDVKLFGYNTIIFWRLFLPYDFSWFDRILYIDTDTVICDDISQVLMVDMGDNIIAGVEDFDISIVKYDFFVEERRDFQDATREGYINAGLLMFDTAKCQKACSREQMLDAAIEAAKEYYFSEQTLLNVLFQGKIFHLPLRWNFQLKVNGNYDDSRLQEAMTDMGLIHYLTKPWSTLNTARKEDMIYFDYFYDMKSLLVGVEF